MAEAPQPPANKRCKPSDEHADATTDDSRDSTSSSVDEAMPDLSSSKIGEGIAFYCYDVAGGNGRDPWSVLLFGKIAARQDGGMISCCVQVKSVSRVFYAFPRSDDVLDEAMDEIAAVAHECGIDDAKVSFTSPAFG
jgi:hypothetical protein